MERGNYEYQSHFARMYVAEGRGQGLKKGREEGLEKGLSVGVQAGLQAGLQAGREEGLQEGLLQGRPEGARTALLEVLDARGLKVDEASRQHIMECSDHSRLMRWIRKAVSVKSAPELFEAKPDSHP